MNEMVRAIFSPGLTVEAIEKLIDRYWPAWPATA